MEKLSNVNKTDILPVFQFVGWADAGSPTKNLVGFRALRRSAQPTYMSARALLENIFAGLETTVS